MKASMQSAALSSSQPEAFIKPISTIVKSVNGFRSQSTRFRQETRRPFSVEQRKRLPTRSFLLGLFSQPDILSVLLDLPSQSDDFRVLKQQLSLQFLLPLLVLPNLKTHKIFQHTSNSTAYSPWLVLVLPNLQTQKIFQPLLMLLGFIRLQYCW